MIERAQRALHDFARTRGNAVRVFSFSRFAAQNVRASPSTCGHDTAEVVAAVPAAKSSNAARERLNRSPQSLNRPDHATVADRHYESRCDEVRSGRRDAAASVGIPRHICIRRRFIRRGLLARHWHAWIVAALRPWPAAAPHKKQHRRKNQHQRKNHENVAEHACTIRTPSRRGIGRPFGAPRRHLPYAIAANSRTTIGREPDGTLSRNFVKSAPVPFP